MIQIIPVPSNVAPDAADQVADEIARALEHGGDFGLEDVKEKLAARDWQLWLATEDGKSAGVVITHVAARPKLKVVEVILASGDGEDRWGPEMERVVAQWGRELGCTAIDETGRDGWCPRLKRRGWKRIGVVMRKELADA